MSSTSRCNGGEAIVHGAEGTETRFLCETAFAMSFPTTFRPVALEGPWSVAEPALELRGRPSVSQATGWRPGRPLAGLGIVPYSPPSPTRPLMRCSARE